MSDCSGGLIASKPVSASMISAVSAAISIADRLVSSLSGPVEVAINRSSVDGGGLEHYTEFPLAYLARRLLCWLVSDLLS